jgi:hypothetical protein
MVSGQESVASRLQAVKDRLAAAKSKDYSAQLDASR